MANKVTKGAYTHATDAFPITPSDTVLIASDPGNLVGYPFVDVYVGGAGAVKVMMADGGIVTFTAPVLGSKLGVNVVQVFATGTTATLLIGMVGRCFQ